MLLVVFNVNMFYSYAYENLFTTQSISFSPNKKNNNINRYIYYIFREKFFLKFKQIIQFPKKTKSP